MKKILVIGCLLVIVSCKTQKSLTKTRTETTVTTKDSIKTTVNTSVKVLEFNDTLRTNSYVPMDGASTSFSDRTVVAESRGIKVTAVITPRKDSLGRITGNDIHLEAVAKPVQQMQIDTKAESSASTTRSERTETKSRVKETKKSLLSLPWWVWMIAGGAAFIFLLIRFGKKYFKHFI